MPGARDRGGPLLLGHPGAPGADLAALRDLLLRVSQLAADLPQIAELELSPVFARPDGVQAVDARIRLQAAAGPADAHLRRLPDPPAVITWPATARFRTRDRFAIVVLPQQRVPLAPDRARLRARARPCRSSCRAQDRPGQGLSALSAIRKWA